MKCHHSPTLVLILYPSLLFMFYATPICLSCQDTRSDSLLLSTLPTSKDLFIFGQFDCHYPLWDYTSLISFEIRVFFCSLSLATIFNCCCLLVLLNWPRQNCIPYGKTFNFFGYLFAPTHLQYILDFPGFSVNLQNFLLHHHPQVR